MWPRRQFPAGAARHIGPRRWLWISGLLLVSCGCGPILILVGEDAPQPNPPLDFARAHALARMASDVTKNGSVPDETLVARYGTEGVVAMVFGTVYPGDDGESRFMLLTDPAQRRQTVVLGGTNTQLQWKVDAATAPAYQADLGANVHQGWNTAAFAVYDRLLPELRSDYALTVTGFSLGAALSCIVSQYLTLAGYTVDEVVTFGQPRITDAAGAAVFDVLPITRFVNDGDPFPHVKETGSSAAHFGRMVLLYDGPYYAYVPAGDPRREAESQPFDSFRQLEFGFHSEDLYLERLAAKVADAVEVEYQP